MAVIASGSRFDSVPWHRQAELAEAREALEAAKTDAARRQGAAHALQQQLAALQQQLRQQQQARLLCLMSLELVVCYQSARAAE